MCVCVCERERERERERETLRETLRERARNPLTAGLLRCTAIISALQEQTCAVSRDATALLMASTDVACDCSPSGPWC